MVFARKGLATTMDDIATEASISHGLAYRYFANKEAILLALLEQSLNASSVNIQLIKEMQGTPGQRLESLLTKMIDGRRQPQYFQVLNQVLGSEAAPEDLRQLVSTRRRILCDMVRELIVEGQATGEVVLEDPDQLVLATFAYLDGLIQFSDYNSKQYSDHFPDPKIFLRMLKPAESQPHLTYFFRRGINRAP